MESGSVFNIQCFYETEEQFDGFFRRLKHSACPHCGLRGFLILHGFLYGYAESDDLTRVRRGHRIYCSRRNDKRGCGRTFCVLNSGFIKNCTLSAACVWAFLDKIKQGLYPAKALRKSGSAMKASSIYRILARFKRNQSRIRAFLARIKGPPPSEHTRQPVVQTLLHLASTFTSECPISQFQYHFQTKFF
jgi:hypothetical protein